MGGAFVLQFGVFFAASVQGPAQRRVMFGLRFENFVAASAGLPRSSILCVNISKSSVHRVIHRRPFAGMEATTVRVSTARTNSRPTFGRWFGVDVFVELHTLENY